MIRYEVLKAVSDGEVADIGDLIEVLSPSAKRPDRDVIKEVVEKQALIVARDTAVWREPIVGMATLVIISQLVGMRGRVEDVAVRKDYGGKGIGKGLMLKLHETALECGISLIALSCNPNREAGNKLYPSVGYRPIVTNVYIIELDKL